MPVLFGYQTPDHYVFNSNEAKVLQEMENSFLDWLPNVQGFANRDIANASNRAVLDQGQTHGIKAIRSGAG